MKIFSLKNKSNLHRNLLIYLGIILLLLLWETVALIINNNIYLPRIEEVFSSILVIFKSNDFLLNVLTSMARTFISFFVAFFMAIVLGILSVLFNPFYEILKPFNAIIKTIPTMILVVLSLVWFDKDKTPYIVGTLIVFPIFYQGIVSTISNVDNKILDMLKIYGVSKKTMIIKVYIPVIIFFIARTFAATFSLAFKVVIAGEVHGQPTYGIGSCVQSAKANFNISQIFGWIVIIAILSIIFDMINVFLHKKINNWWGKYENKSY